MTFLPVYLLYLIAKSQGCIATVLLGNERITTLRQGNNNLQYKRVSWPRL